MSAFTLSFYLQRVIMLVNSYWASSLTESSSAEKRLIASISAYRENWFSGSWLR